MPAAQPGSLRPKSLAGVTMKNRGEAHARFCLSFCLVVAGGASGQLGQFESFTNVKASAIISSGHCVR